MRIEAAMQTLNPGEPVFVDTSGMLHKSRAPFYEIEGPKPLASVWRTSGGRELIVYPGLMPANDIYCRWYPAEGREPELHGPLQGPFIARSGDVLYLSKHCAVQVPSRAEPTPMSPSETLAFMLAVAQPGESVPLGRGIVPSCDGAVGRIHCTATVLSKDQRSDGSFYLRLSAFPGIPSGTEISQRMVDGSLEPITGQAPVLPGTRLWFGDSIGEVISS